MTTEPAPTGAEHHAVLTIRCHTAEARDAVLVELGEHAGELLAKPDVASVDLRPKTVSGDHRAPARSVPTPADMARVRPGGGA